MGKDFLKKEPSQMEKYIDYRFNRIEHDLIVLQRQVTTIARLMKLEASGFIQGMNEMEATQKYIEQMNEEFKKQQEEMQKLAAEEASKKPANDPAKEENAN
jgi:hypothetical protein